MNLQTIRTLIIDSLKEYNQELQSKELQNPTIDTRLYGSPPAAGSVGGAFFGGGFGGEH